jgi:hypothetical protein
MSNFTLIRMSKKTPFPVAFGNLSVWVLTFIKNPKGLHTYEQFHADSNEQENPIPCSFRKPFGLGFDFFQKPERFSLV